MKFIDRLALILTILGGIHLLLVGAFQVNIFELIFGTGNQQAINISYIVIGISALWCLKYFSYTPKGGSRLRGR
ncbi:DUF378 domain-containing protein [Dolosigranulum pigrum]|uniref:DUF378 domain-containing protein n=1 Tax=Dolosigranulum pigrum TaxID=29394 RepID=UPI001AD86A0D|nr:DUF378 domain-containing protein [Dolosigranulum pigrum]QTJ52631.1 DUF378 domain-containing protein [Dolosigranulum pigrum]